MEPGDRPQRFETLLHASSQMDSAEERRSFLESVCDGEPALLAELLETVTLEGTLYGTPAYASFQQGQIVAERFEVLRAIGQGGMATVYEAIDRKLSERRALKFPKAGYSRTMPPEARSALQVTHDNICRIHEIHTTQTDSGPADFISMELLEGETLLNRWRRKPLEPNEAIDIGRQLCRGLAAAHRAHILHRDLKSNNVMLTRHADGSPRVVITDFGLARPLASGHGPASSSIAGTPNYIAPEIWKGAEPSPSSDIYSLGVVLYEMLAGRLPFPSDTPWQTRLTRLPEPPSRSDRAPDPRWDPVALRCLDPDPSKRFAAAGDVLDAIESAFRISHRRKWLAGATAAILIIGSAVVWRDRIWPPPPLARLAVLPFTGSTADKMMDQAVKGGLYDVAERLSTLGTSSRWLVVIPIADSVRYEVNSPASAASKLGATHVLSGAIGAGDRALTVRAAVTDAKTGQAIREFTGEFQRSDLAGLSTSLAGVVTSAFHLDKAPPARISAAAYPSYAAALASYHSPSSKVDETIGLFNAALNLDEGSSLIHAALAESHYRKFVTTRDARWLAEASRYAKRAESLHPDSPPLLVVLGSIEQAEGRPDRAIDLFRRAAELEPNNSEAWRRTGVALQRIGRNNEAITSLQKSMQLAPDYYAPHLSMGFIYFQMGRYSEAVEEYRAVTRLAPELPEGFASLGGALLAIEKDAEAEQALRRALTLRQSRLTLNTLGVLLRFQRRDREATQMLEQALKAGPDDAAIRLNLGNALRQTGRLAEARENFQKASDLMRAALLRDPSNAAARARLAYAMVRIGKRELAADDALQAARLAPSEYPVLFWSLMTLEALGRRGDAFPLLASASHERLRELRRQPDLAEFTRDPRFIALFEASQGVNSNQRKEDGRKN